MKCVKHVSIRTFSSRRERAGMLAMVCPFILTTLFPIADLTFAAILFLCSQEAKWITGLIMPVDGGVSQLSLCRFLCFMLTPRLLCDRQRREKQTDQPSRLIHWQNRPQEFRTTHEVVSRGDRDKPHSYNAFFSWLRVVGWLFINEMHQYNQYIHL